MGQSLRKPGTSFQILSEWSHTAQSPLEQVVTICGNVANPRSLLENRCLELLLGHIGNLYLVCTKVLDSQKEASIQHKPHCTVQVVWSW